MNAAELIAWIRAHRDLLNLKGFSEAIRLEYTTLNKIVNGRRDAYGYPIRLPERCLPAMIHIISSLGRIPAAG
jgi:hypothetical protein